MKKIFLLTKESTVVEIFRVKLRIEGTHKEVYELGYVESLHLPLPNTWISIEYGAYTLVACVRQVLHTCYGAGKSGAHPRPPIVEVWLWDLHDIELFRAYWRSTTVLQETLSKRRIADMLTEDVTVVH